MLFPASLIVVLPRWVAIAWVRSFSRIARPTRPAAQPPPDELMPSALGILGIGKKIEIGLCNHSFLDERREIYNATPIWFFDKNDRDGGHFGGLHQRQ